MNFCFQAVPMVDVKLLLRLQDKSTFKGIDMIKIVSGVALFFVAGGAWLYLDCLNKREQDITVQAQQGLLQARAEGARRVEAKTNFASNLLANLTSCQAAAEKAKTDYANLIQQVAPSKRGQIIIPQAVIATTESILAAAKAECQLTYDTHMQKGL